MDTASDKIDLTFTKCLCIGGGGGGFGLFVFCFCFCFRVCQDASQSVVPVAQRQKFLSYHGLLQISRPY